MRESSSRAKCFRRWKTADRYRCRRDLIPVVSTAQSNLPSPQLTPSKWQISRIQLIVSRSNRKESKAPKVRSMCQR